MPKKKTRFKETDKVGFDHEGFVVHKPCGEKLVEEWSITRTESYFLKQDGTMPLADEGGDDRDCDGTWCEECDVTVVLTEVESE